MSEMSPEQERALDALRSAHDIYRRADANRSRIMGICMICGVPTAEIAEATGVPFEAPEVAA